MKRIKNCAKNETVTSSCRTVTTLIRAGAGLCAHLVVLSMLGVASLAAWAQGLPLKTCPGQSGQFYLCQGDIVLADANAGPPIAWKGSSGALLLIDPASGARTIVSQGGLLQETVGVVVEDDGNLVATDRITGLIRVNPANGGQTVLSSANPLLNDYFGITRNANGDFIVTDTGWDSTTVYPGRTPLNQTGRVLLIDKTSGAVSVFAQGSPFAHPFGVAVDPVNASIVVSDMSAFSHQGAIFRLPPDGGNPTVVWGPWGSGPGLVVQKAGVNCPMEVTVKAPEDILATVFNLAFNACGSTEIDGLAVNGQSIVVTSSPNETPSLRGGLMTLNEQNGSFQRQNGNIPVNALHVTVPGVIDAVIPSGFALVGGGPLAPIRPLLVAGGGGGGGGGGCDFVTGGGWIITPSGAKGTFGVGGGIRQGAFWGHLEYHDHGTGMNVHGTGVTAYRVTGPTSRHIEGTADVNGQSGFTYMVDVADKGKPGRNDTFEIQVSNGYVSGPAPADLSGGKIQLHTNPNSCS